MEKYIVINSNESLEDKLFRLDKRTVLKLKPGPKFLALDVSLKTNYPLKKNAKFNRAKYYDLTIVSDHQDSISSALNWSTSVQLDLAGTFHFVCSSPFSVEPIWQAYVVVNPDLRVPINAIKCQTVLSKNLGPFREWRKRLSLTKEANYNMIHFTPVQELGSSNSAYALRNQHKVNPTFEASLDDIKKEVDYMEKKWGVLSLTDIVLNHTANDSDWIRKHPECAYNMVNSPHLRPAFLLDSAFIWLATDMAAGLLEKTVHLSDMITTERDVEIIGIMLKTYYVAQLRIYELFMIDVGEAVARFDKLERRGSTLEIDYGLYERNKARVISIPESVADVHQLNRLLLDENQRKRNEIRGLLDGAVNNALNAIRYERLNPSGPYFGLPVNGDDCPLVAPYFTHTPSDQFTVASEERAMYSAGQSFMAHNGWVMGAATVEDFASKQSQVYLKRELVAWGDCIKLRFGSGPDEVPYLWEHMRKYTEAQAKVFHGFRLDNCHSTPLHVAEFVVDAARSVRPDIYIMAELFTSSESMDNIYVNRLGITALIREAMSAHSSQELGRLIYRFGGTPVGAFYQHGAEPLKGGVANALFYDQTHDNESAVEKRSAHDVPATAALLNMANCATGSTRGYDELVPHHINVVSETRPYPLTVNGESGILPLRRILNGSLKQELLDGFSEIFVDQRNEHTIAVTRQNPVDGRSIVLVARTAFSKELSSCLFAPITIEGTVSRILFEAQAYGDASKYLRDDKFINGLASFRTKIFSTNVAASQSKLAQIEQIDTNRAEVRLNEFQFLPSSVLAFEVCLSAEQSGALQVLNEWRTNLDQFELSLSDANYILFRCQQEDNFKPYALPGFCDFTYSGLYGLMYHLEKVRENQDQAHPLAKNLREGNWLSDYVVNRLKLRPSTRALGEHVELALRQLQLLPRGMVPKYFDLVITKLYNELVDLVLKQMNTFVREGPKMVKLLALASVALIGECDSAPLPSLESKLPVGNQQQQLLPSIAAGLPHFASGFMRNWGRDTFISLRGLLLITGRYAEAKSIILAYARTLKHGLIPNLLSGGEQSRYNCRDAVWWWLYSIREYTKIVPNGAEILRQRVKRIHKPEAIMANGAALEATAGGGSGAGGSTGGSAASGQPKRKRSAALMANGCHESAGSQQLCDIMQEALECHFKGMEFVEERAGKQLDEHMREPGFTVTYGVRRDTGFVFGGNEWNCGTWMDKMGSSEKADNKGKPASPRDGSAIEIVGLCKAVVSWLDEMSKNNRLYPYDGVESLYDNTITLKWPWKKWANLIQANFERHFFIPFEVNGSSSGAGGSNQSAHDEPHPELINRRGIYKDTLGASRAWQDYQFRPNFLVAMVVAPELFDKVNARHAILLAKEHLCGPLGMKTLDHSDWNYCGDYDNGEDSDNPKVAHGFNYHQGPEWLWLTGYYIRASSKFIGLEERPHHLRLLANLYSSLVDSPWLGLPELTNSNGKFCPDSCPIQAWSLATVLETLYESVRNV